MTLYQFNTLSQTKRLEAVYDIGNFVTHRVNGLTKHLLYQVGDFYVELLYDEKDNQVKGSRSFRQGIHLEPYLKQADISQLMT